MLNGGNHLAWDVFSMIGTIAFAISGAIIAMEEKYDLFGVYILGVVTAFGGGAVRNLLIGVPTPLFGIKDCCFKLHRISITVIFFFST